MITSVIMTAQQVGTCFWELQDKERLKSIKNLHSTVYGSAAVIVRGIMEVCMHYLGTSCYSCLLQEERNAWGQTWCHGPASLVMIPFWNIIELDDDEVPKFSWVVYCCWSASWALCSNVLHSWRWKQQNLPLHILDSAMHCPDERTKVKMISFFFWLLFMYMGELVSPKSVCVAQCTRLSSGVLCLPESLLLCPAIVSSLPEVSLVFFPFHG